MRAEFRGPSGSRQPSDVVPLFATATAGATLVPGQLVKASGNPFTVVAAGDGESVYGVCRSHAASGETVSVLIQGITTLTAKSGASWASHRRVCAAASGEVDEGSTNDPWFGTLLSHDGNVALVMVHGDALPSLARGVRAADGTAYAFGTLTSDQPVVLRTGRAESVRPIGTTAQRPSSPYNGQTYYDTDVDKLITWDGVSWVDPIPAGAGTGAVTATTVEVNLSATPKYEGRFTITDAAISATSKVLCWQAPGPYTGKGTLADEAQMFPVQVIAVNPGTGSAVVYWQTPPIYAVSPRLPESPKLNTRSVLETRGQSLRRIGKVRGNVKFSYMVMA